MNTKLSNNLTLFAVLIAIGGIMLAFMPAQFGSLRNFTSMTRQFPEYGLLSLANMLAMITGGIDLSVVSIASLSGVAAASFLSHYATLGLPVGTVIAIGILIALSVSVLCGLVNGLIIAYARVPAIIATLGTQGLFLGISIIATKGHGIGGFPPAFLLIGNGYLFGLPAQFFIFVIVALLVALVLTRTPQGFSMLMYGSNPQVARFSGINNEAVLIKTYMMTGLLAGVASLVIISGVNSIRPGYGADYLLLSVLIAILGGTDPAGGFGTVLGLSLAIFIMQVLQSGLNIMSFSPFMKKFIWGLVLILIMVFHFYRRRYAMRRAVRKSAAQREAAGSGPQAAGPAS